MRHDPKSLRLVPLTVWLPACCWAVAAASTQLAELQRQRSDTPPPPPPRRCRAAFQIRAGGIRRPLGLHVLPKRSRSGADHQHRARPVQVALCDRQGAGRRRHDAPGGRAPADRAAAQGQPRGQELHRAGRRRPASRRTVKSCPSTAGCWSRATSIPTPPTATATWSTCAARLRLKRQRRHYGGSNRPPFRVRDLAQASWRPRQSAQRSRNRSRSRRWG